MPSTILSYLQLIQRGFRDWGFNISIRSGLLLDDKKHGSRAVVNSKLAEQHSRGMNTRLYSAVSNSGVFKIMSSNCVSLEWPETYFHRLVFVTWLALSIRITAMAELCVDQFHFSSQDGVGP